MKNAAVMKDYYKILNVPKDASAEAIHEAYRKAVKIYHPDVAGTGSHEKFLEIKEAYEVLSNPEKRRHYDMMRESSFATFGRYRVPVQPSPDYPIARAELLLTLREAYYGGLFTVDVPFVMACPLCGGRPWLSWFCVMCGGVGKIQELIPVDVKVPPRVLPGTVIIKDMEVPGIGPIRVEFLCRIRTIRHSWRRFRSF